MNEYPPYACPCCGVVNGDMCWDYIKHNAHTLTYAEVMQLSDEFDSYRNEWNAHAEATREAVSRGRTSKSHGRRVKMNDEQLAKLRKLIKEEL